MKDWRCQVISWRKKGIGYLPSFSVFVFLCSCLLPLTKLSAQTTVVDVTYPTGQESLILDAVSISTSGTVVVPSGADVVFAAPAGITLQPGFSVSVGGVFSAELDPSAHGDFTPPSVPVGLSASDVRSVSYIMNWSASTDDVQVAEYEVMRDTTLLGSTTGTSMTVTSLNYPSSYEMKVRARDDAGNWSDWSSGLIVSTVGQSLVNINPTDATIEFGQNVLFSASGGSGNIDYTWEEAATGTGINKLVTPSSVGIHNVSVYNPANSDWVDSNTAIASITVNKATPNGTFSDRNFATLHTVSASDLDATFANPHGAGAAPTGTITYSIAEGTVLGAGTHTITAMYPGDANYHSTSVFANFTVDSVPQSAVVISPPWTSISVGESVTFTASGGSGLKNYTWGGEASGTGTSKTVTFSNAGTFEVSVQNPANDSYADSNIALATITVSASGQAPVQVSPVESVIYVNESLTFTASGGSGSINYTWGDAASGTGLSKNVVFTTAGTHWVTVYNPANGSFPDSNLATAAITVLEVPTPSDWSVSVGSWEASTLSVAGSSPPYAVSAGNLPAGISLNGATGELSGEATTPGRYTVSFSATGSPITDFSIHVNAATALPEVTGFEATQGYGLGNVSNQKNWALPYGESQIGSFAQSGSAGLLLSDTLGQAEVTRAFLPNGSAIVFADLQVRPTALADREDSTRIDLGIAQIGFTASGSVAKVEVLDGDLNQGGTWRDTGFTVPVDGQGTATTWVRLTARLDYFSDQWDLSVDGALAYAELGSYDQALSHLSLLRLSGATAGDSAFDDLNISSDNPAMLGNDVDRDGLPDDWEVIHGLNPAVDDRAGDIDNDGLSNLSEYWLGTRPGNPDTDGDAASDGGEVSAGTDPLTAALQLKNQISGGWEHNFAIKSDGSLWAWGHNAHGKLGDGTTSSRNIPKHISGISNVVLVDGGNHHTVALRSDGTVWAWGRNNYGQIGDGTTSTRKSPVMVPGLSGVVDVSAGEYFSVALKNDGTVWTWGRGTWGMLGNGSTSTQNSPVQVIGLSDVVDIAADQRHVLALERDGTVKAWGNNEYGQLGDGTTTDRSSPISVQGIAEVIEVAAFSHSLALRADGTIWAWGRNEQGAVGDGTTTHRYIPTAVTGLNDVTSIAVGSVFSTALDQNGDVWAWGLSWYGRLGGGYESNQPVPVLTYSEGDAVAVSAGVVQSQFLLADGTVWLSGRDRYGESGQYGYRYAKTRIVQAFHLEDIEEVVAGYHTSYAKDTDGSVWSWGFYNSYGQLGHGHTSWVQKPSKIAGLGGVSELKATYHAVALKNDGSLWVWGRNDYGQLGDGTTTNRSNPKEITSLSNVVDFTVGSLFTVAKTSDGNFWSWGVNSDGQLGDGTTNNRSSPGQILGLTDVAEFDAGGAHVLMLKTDGTVWAWGRNDYGELGDGTTTDRTTPVQVSGLAGVTMIKAGGNYSLAVKSDGTVWSWGRNDQKQLGDGTTTNRSTPVQVQGVSAPVSLHARSLTNFAVLADGTVKGWGRGDRGIFGNGSWNDQGSAVTVQETSNPGPLNPVSLSVGVYHGMALLSDGTQRAWGGDANNELGDEFYFHSPARIRLWADPSDSDGDALPDSFELLWFGDLSQSGTGDFDYDGLNNFQEFAIGTHPTDANIDGDRFTDYIDPDPYHFFNSAAPLVAKISGDAQTAVAGTFSTNVLVSEVTDSVSGAFLANASATISVTGGGGLVSLSNDGQGLASSLAVTSDASGQIRFYYRHASGAPTTSEITVDCAGASVAFTATSTTAVDGDSNGLADAWEIEHFGATGQSPSADADNDGLTNLEEHENGTDPNVTDTDGDGYDDAFEVANAGSGYDPVVFNAGPGGGDESVPVSMLSDGQAFQIKDNSDARHQVKSSDLSVDKQ